MSPAIYGIARVAGVSKPTVSHILNKRTNISPEAREKVLRAIEELQYQPNKLAHALTFSGLNATMVIFTRSAKATAGNLFFLEALHAITAKTEEEGFDMILQTSHSLAEGLQKYESKIKQKTIKGITALNSSADKSFFIQLDKYDILVVVVDKVGGQYAHVYSVDTDNLGDGIALTDALIKSRHRNIACLYAPLDVHVSVDRVNGCKQSLAARNIAVCNEWIVDGGYTHETALQAARELLSQSPLSEVVFATDSLKLVSIYRTAIGKNIAIPQQSAVVGYSNETLSFISTLAPGGIDIPTQELDQQSYELLFRLISGKPSLQNITVAMHMTLKRIPATLPEYRMRYQRILSDLHLQFG